MTTSRPILLAAALSALLGAALAGCTHLSQERNDATVTRSLEAADAYREAVRRCGQAGVRQAEGTSGTSPSDYSCTDN